MKGKEQGFSLIELSIALVVIGLLITAVTVGKNVLRTAEMNRIFTDGVNHWVKSIYIYYERYGRLVGDTGADCTSNAICSATLSAKGLTSGFYLGLAQAAYTSAEGIAGRVQLKSVVAASDKRSVTVTLEDSLGQQGLTAIRGLVNGSTPTTVAPYTMTFTMSQFGSNN